MLPGLGWALSLGKGHRDFVALHSTNLLFAGCRRVLDAFAEVLPALESADSEMIERRRATRNVQARHVGPAPFPEP